jgi:hypothetical protein
MADDFLNGRNSHFNAGIALPQQLDGILLDHKTTPFLFLEW